MNKLIARIFAASLLLLLCSAGRTENDPTVRRVPEPSSASRGQIGTVTGDHLPTKDVKVALRTEAPGDKGDSALLDATVTDGRTLTFKVPQDRLDPGRYLIYMRWSSGE